MNVISVIIFKITQGYIISQESVRNIRAFRMYNVLFQKREKSILTAGSERGSKEIHEVEQGCENLTTERASRKRERKKERERERKKTVRNKVILPLSS